MNSFFHSQVHSQPFIPSSAPHLPLPLLFARTSPRVSTFHQSSLRSPFTPVSLPHYDRFLQSRERIAPYRVASRPHRIASHRITRSSPRWVAEKETVPSVLLRHKTVPKFFKGNEFAAPRPPCHPPTSGRGFPVVNNHSHHYYFRIATVSSGWILVLRG